MAVTSSLDPNSERYAITSEGPTASREWLIDGTNNPMEAVEATPIEPGNPPLAKFNESWPWRADLRCRFAGVVSKPGPMSWRYRADYGIPRSGSYDPVDADPLSRKPTITWNTGIITVPTDRDLQGRAMVNAAGDAFDPPQQREIKVKHLVIEQYENKYDYAATAPFENSVNSKPLVFDGVTYDTGDMYCDTIQPAATYNVGAPHVLMRYSFSIMEDYIVDASGQPIKIQQPWQWFIKNVGRRAWYLGAGGKAEIGELCYTRSVSGSSSTIGTPVSRDIPLDLQGRPVSSYQDLRVSPDGINMAAATSAPLDLNLTIAPHSPPQLLILRFIKVKSMDLTLLPLRGNP